MTTSRWMLSVFVVFFFGCLPFLGSAKNYDEIPSMLNLLTNATQSAVDQGYLERGEDAVLDHVREIDPRLIRWYEDRGLDLRVGKVAGYAVVVVCDEGAAIFEDTFCDGGPPDRDYRGRSAKMPCRVNLTMDDVQGICH